MNENRYIKTMEEFFLPPNSGKVGIFWYDRVDESLFGVVKESPYLESSKINSNLPSGEKAITVKRLHKQIWAKEFNKNKSLGIKSPFVGDYKDTPRGRVFYIVDEKKFVICVGEWIKDYNDVVDLIVDEFDLWDEKYEINIDHHWDIGSGWRLQNNLLSL